MKKSMLMLLVLLLGLCWGIRLYALIQPGGSFPLRLKWQVNLGYSSHERPAYQNGLVFLPASGIVSSYAYGIAGSNWYGINAETGQAVWSQQTGLYDFLRCLSQEYLVVSGPYSLRVLKLRTGEINWEEDYAAYSATCSKKVVFSSGVARDSIYASELSTGQQTWNGTTPKKSFFGLVYNPDTEEIIAKETNLPGDMYIIDAKTGTLKDSFDKVRYAPTDRSWQRGPMYLVDQGELFIEGTVLDASTGRVIHKEDRYSSIVPPTVTTETMYLSALGDGVVAFDRATYKVKWVYQPQPKMEWVSANPLSPIAILNGIGYGVFSDATLRAFDLETGQELGYWQLELLDLWAWPVCAFPPVPTCVGTARAGLTASDDMLFVSFGNGKLYAFGQE